MGKSILAVNTRQAAETLGVSEWTLLRWRTEGKGPNYVKTAPNQGGRVIYRVKDLEAWLEENLVSTGGNNNESD